MPDKSKLEEILEGNTLDNKQKNAAEFVAPGGMGINDYSLEPAGFANNLRMAAEANERTVQTIPIVVDQSIDKHFATIQESLAESLQRMELLQRKAPRQKSTGVDRSISLPSLGLGVLVGLLVMLGISWFWLIPAQVAYQRGSDWAIGEYLSTPEGRAVRQYYRNCKLKGCKK